MPRSVSSSSFSVSGSLSLIEIGRTGPEDEAEGCEPDVACLGLLSGGCSSSSSSLCLIFIGPELSFSFFFLSFLSLLSFLSFLSFLFGGRGESGGSLSLDLDRLRGADLSGLS